jgi:hypothetical protein
VRRSAGIARKTSYATLVIVGRIMRARTSDPANQLKPRVKPIPAKFSRRYGTSTVIPSQPYTTDGIPTKTSIAGRVIERAHPGATSAMKSASPTDSGVAMTAATSITPSVPATNGRIPNVVWAPPSGFQLVLRTLLSVTWESGEKCDAVRDDEEEQQRDEEHHEHGSRERGPAGQVNALPGRPAAPDPGGRRWEREIGHRCGPSRSQRRGPRREARAPGASRSCAGTSSGYFVMGP